ncbi:MAG TPA: lysylphosphatidylglycerol synthase transmembrane domain-containing protein [Anaerolineaceae bacterium]|nr:lysylphosphatidylglycerol synthase transmembrane domain-containing protein [Anaerolineaceae bacterium]
METTPAKPNKSQRPRWYIILVVILSGILLYFALQGISWNEVLATVKQSDLKFLSLSIGLGTISLFMRGVRWGVLLSNEKKISPWTMLWNIAIGYLGNLFLPARAGEVVRSVVLGRKTGISISYIFATAITERVIDAVILVVAGAALLPTQANLPAWLPQALQIMAVLGAAAILFLIIAPLFEPFLQKVLNLLPLPAAWKAKLGQFMSQFLLGGRAFVHPKRAVGFLLYSVVIWSLDTLSAVVTAHALHLSISMSQAFLFLVALGLSSAIPSTPGYVGVYQFVAVSVLPIFGINRSQALVYVLVMQAIGIIVNVILGIIGVWQLGIRREDWKAQPQNDQL